MLLFAVTLAAIFLSIALGVANVALKEINFSTSAKDTNDAFFAADSGIEQALYNDKTSGFYPDNGKVSFIVPNLGSASQGCAYVTVDKTASPTVIITANGYNIGNGSCNSTNPNRVERELVTTYSGVTNYTVTGQVSGGNGTITPASQNINSGSPATLNASPNTGYSTSFSSTCGGTPSGNSFTIASVTSTCQVTASFSLNTYTVTPSAGSNGSISPNTPQTVNSGATTSFTITPSSGYTASASGCGGSPTSSQSSAYTYTTGAITTNCTVTASFTLINTLPIDYLIVAGGGGGGMGSVNHRGAGGGGAGGVVSGNTTVSSVSPLSINVGIGGAAAINSSVVASNGGDSWVTGLTTAKGGGGGNSADGGGNGANGGSGGGAGDNNGSFASGGSGSQGSAGGNNGTSGGCGGSGGGGGGKTSAGGVGVNCGGSNIAGGNGMSSNISGSSMTYAAGGAGGSSVGHTNGSNGADNTGNGGVGGQGGNYTTNATGGVGGSGIVIIRYLDSGGQQATGGTVTHIGGYYIHTFMSSGTFSVN